MYLLIKRGLYWRPKSAGYTGLKSEAGRYTKEEAEERCNEDVSMISVDEAPIFSPGCSHYSKIEYYAGKIDNILIYISELKKEEEFYREQILNSKNPNNTHSVWVGRLVENQNIRSDLEKLLNDNTK